MNVTHSHLPRLLRWCIYATSGFRSLDFRPSLLQHLTLQPTSLLPIGRHSTVLPTLALRQHCLREISHPPKAWLYLKNENMLFPYPNSKENILVTDRQENSVLLQLRLQVAISDKHRNMEGSLVPSETSLRDVFVAIFSYKNKKQSLAEGLLHNPHKKQKHFSITAESC